MQRQQIVQLVGGLDLVTPAIAMPEGRCIACLNYESEARGYRRVEGYERFDGQPKPSEGTYWTLSFTSGSTEIVADDVVTGDTSSATGTALFTVVESGTWAGGDATGYVVLYNVSGTFQNAEGLEVSASNVATAASEATEDGASTDALNSTYTVAAQTARRAVIAAVPGSGEIRGMFIYNGDTYAIRDNVGATEAVLHKATSSGWSAQSFGHTIDYDAGTAPFTEGETLTGGTSAATATIERVVHSSGTFSAGTGTGYLVLSGVSGTFVDDETIASAGGSATSVGAAAAITWAAGGRYRAVEHNFFGSDNKKRMYLVSGTHRAMEWDGTVMAPIRTGLSDLLDRPRFVDVMRDHLFLAFDGGSMLFSGAGLPLSFVTTDGAGEIAFGETLTGIKSQNKGAMIIAGRNKIGYLTGTSALDFNLQVISSDSGAIEDTLEVVGRPYFLDDMGIRDLEAAQSFGDWKLGTITSLIEPLIRKKRLNGISVVGIQRNRKKDQMRLWYSDGSGISIYVGRQTPEAMLFQVGFTPVLVASGEDSDGFEVLLAGSDDGFVYEIDKGKSFDGGVVEAYLRPAFLHQGSPNQWKRYHRAFLDVITSEASTTLSFASDYSYGATDLTSGSETSQSIAAGGAFWDTEFWNNFNWSSPFQAGTEVELNGVGENVSLVFMSDATNEEPHVLSSLTVNYTPRRQKR